MVAPTGDRADFSSCSGCSLCLLVCPVWREKRDLRFTPHGRAKALQNGVPVADLAASIDSCTMCGACEPVCPENIDLIGMTLRLRAQLPQIDLSIAQAAGQAGDWSGRAVLLTTPSLQGDQALLGRVTKLLACGIASDNGHDLSLAVEAGMTVPDGRREQFLLPLRSASEILVADGRLVRTLKQWLPGKKIVSLGLALSRQPSVRRALIAGDFYVIDPPAYHVEQEQLVQHYDDLRHESGCSMNLDLQRIAIPATARSLRQRLGMDAFDDVEQTRWLLKGRKISRVIVENADDMRVLRERAGVPVVHLAELA
jgi:ferredoxin